MPGGQSTMWTLLPFALLILLPLQFSSHVSAMDLHVRLRENGFYNSRFENLDLDLILASRRLVHNYVACLMDVKPCTAEGDELKRILPDALKTKCAKCSMKQKEGAKKAINTLQLKYPEQWEALKKKWDLEKFKQIL